MFHSNVNHINLSIKRLSALHNAIKFNKPLQLNRFLHSNEEIQQSSCDIFDFTQNQLSFRDSIRNFVAKHVEPQAIDYNTRSEFNLELFNTFGKAKLLGLTAPVEYKGQMMDGVGACIFYEEVAYSDPAFCLSLLSHTILCGHNLSFNGDKEQKDRWLSDICTGAKIGGIGLTEPKSGTDLLSMDSHYEKKGDFYILNGSKLYVTNTGYGDLYLVYARDVNLLNDKDPANRKKGFSLFAVEKGMEGFEQHRMMNKHGMKASPWGELSFHNVKIPVENMIGKEGTGLIPMMRNLEIERLTCAAISLGITRRCLVEMIQFSQTRKIGPNKLLYQSDETVRKITNAYSKYSCGACKLYSTARHLNFSQAGNRLSTDSSKLTIARDAEDVSLDAMHLFGAAGNTYDFVLGRLHMDAFTMSIGAGTEEALRKNIAKDIFKYHIDPTTLF